jgi:hypothetical protein
MEIDEKRIIELFLGLIFIALLLIASILVINISGNKQTSVQMPNVIQNSYNTNSYNQVIQKPVENTVRTSTYVKAYNFERDSVEKLRYSSYGEHLRDRAWFDNYKDEFRVYVVNKDYEGEYFKVKFRFCDYYNNCFTETIEKYIPAKEESKFVYLDIQSERYKYYNWEYVVIPDYRE